MFQIIYTVSNEYSIDIRNDTVDEIIKWLNWTEYTTNKQVSKISFFNSVHDIF